MSAIQGVSTCHIQGMAQRQSAGTAPLAAAKPSAAADRLDAVVSATGLSENDRSQLKADLKSALDDVFGSSATLPQPSEVEAAVKSVFSRYGLDADALAEKLKPPEGAGRGRPPWGSPPTRGDGPTGNSCCSGKSSTSIGEDDSSASAGSDSTQSLLDVLDAFLEELSKQSEGSERGQSSQNTSEYLMAGLIGFCADA